MAIDKTNKTLRVYLGNLKPKWLAYCKARNLKPGALLKKAVESELKKSEQNKSDEWKKKGTIEPKGKPEKKPQTFLITTSEKKAAIKAAKKSGTTLRGWIVDVVRAALTVDPQFSMEQIVVLGQSNYQLKMIGINLNQIAKRLNEDPRYTPDLAIIKEITHEVDANIKASSTLIRSCVERWDIK